MKINQFVQNAIEMFIQYVCEDLDIDEPNITFADVDEFPTETTIACINRKTGEIYYNMNYIPNHPDKTPMDYIFFATAHELRHKYQRDNNTHSFDDYQSSSHIDLKTYNEQPVEKDANEYAIKIMDEFSPGWDVYNIKETFNYGY